jgi:TolB-like protein/Flp pilus assembly protein TadD
MKSYQQFFAELKRRKVFRVAAVYGATAFVLLQVADILKEGLRLPESFMPFITAVTLLGFPLALILAWIFEVTTEGVQRTDEAAPGEIEEIISQPLSKRWPAGLAALIGLGALLAGAWWVGTRTGPLAGDATDSPAQAGVRLAYADLADDPRPSIAVLPFVNMSADPQQEYFSDGITEEVLNVLAKLQDLRVAARTSAFAFKGKQMDMRDVGDSLGVRYLIEGSVRKAGNELRITAQLIDAADGSHLWSDSYDRTLDNVFQIQSEIAEAIARELRVPLGMDDPAGLVTPTADIEAYDLYLAGRSRMRERGENVAEAVRLFEAAIARDSLWAPAWAGLAEASEIHLWYMETGTFTYPGQEAIDSGLSKAESAARRALELDPGQASAYVALGNVLRDRFDWVNAEAAYREALALDPDNAEAHQQFSEMLGATGRTSEAVRSAARATALDAAPIRYNILAWSLSLDDRQEEAILAYERGILLDPDIDLVQLRGNLGILHYDNQRFEEAYDIWTTVPGAKEDMDPLWDDYIGLIQGGSLDAFPDSLKTYLSPEEMLHLGEPDRAANMLSNPPGGDWIGSVYRVWSPVFDPIRDTSVMQGYMAAHGLAGVTAQRTPVDERELPAVLRPAQAEVGQ